jgi:hypothetical protein
MPHDDMLDIRLDGNPHRASNRTIKCSRGFGVARAFLRRPRILDRRGGAV